MRLAFFMLSTCLLLAVSPAFAAHRAAAPSAPALGRSLATSTGERLFPSYLGMALPGWLQEFGSSGMRIAYDGFNERRDLPQGRTLLTLRSHGLLGAYVLRQGLCEGEFLFEPLQLPQPDAYRASLRRMGFRGAPAVLATADNTFGADAVDYTRATRMGLEKRTLVELRFERDGQVVHVSCLGAWLQAPRATWSALAPLEHEGRQCLAELCRQMTQQPPDRVFEQNPLF